MKKTKKNIGAMNIVLIIQLTVMLALSLGITKTVTDRTRKNSIEHMSTIAEERSQIIENYVKSAEKTLAAYSNAGEILEVVTNPTDPVAAKNAQNYTEDFSDDVDDLEGIYVSEWNTHVLAHTNSQAVGMTTRTGDSMKALQDAMLAAGDGVYDTGIIMSPASGKQIVSMYKAVYDKSGKPVGLVGLGIYTQGLVDSLNNLTMKGFENANYSMVNVADTKYIFNPVQDKVTTEADNQEIIDLCNKFKGSQSDTSGYFEYTLNGKKNMSIYSYMSDKGWLLMIDDTKSEILSLTSTLRIYLYIFSICCLALMIFFYFINKKQEETARKLTTAVAKNAKTKESLNTAIFKDILTEVNNRVSFSNDFENGKIKNSPDYPYYFTMVNISNFSDVNINYGNDAGDMVLTSTANRLNELFDGFKIYRTGSDEFVISMQMPNSANSYSKVLTTANNALIQLLQPHETSVGQISVNYKMAVVKKSNNVNSSVITSLKDITNRNGVTNPGQIAFVDLDVLR
ncbi:MAG: diguanylate cyclase [Oscillospiraceae bacterium]|nr:diguanylate cyclase [Oscillospiraceae bacterium]